MSQAAQSQGRLDKANSEFRKEYIKAWIGDWLNEVAERDAVIHPSDWLNASLLMIEILIAAQDLEPDQKEKLAFDIVGEMHRRISNIVHPTNAS